MRVLLVEGDPVLAAEIKDMLAKNLFKIDETSDHDDAINMVNVYDYDLVIIGNVPSISDCRGLIVELRSRACKVPILSLVDERDPELIAHLLGCGADDCLSKPFHEIEFEARAHALIRRAKGQATQDVSVGDVVINLNRKTVAVAGDPVHFSPREYDIIELLALRHDRVVTKEALFNYLYEFDDEPMVKILDVYVHKVRRKIAQSKTTIISTSWGRGFYMHLKSDADVVAAAA